MARPLLEARRNLLYALVIGFDKQLAVSGLLLLRERRGLKRLIIDLLQQCGCDGEQGVVEGDDVVTAAPVCLQRLLAHQGRGKITMHLLIEQCPVGVPEAVDALLYIAHDQVLLALRQALLYERTEIFPLHLARVLKFVDHVMVNLRADLLVDERGVTILDDPVQ